MVALAYLVPPVSGLVAFVKGSSVRMRLHGLQAVLLGTLWPASLYVFSWISPGATQAAFVAFALLWLFLMIAAGKGKNPLVPGLGPLLERAAVTSPLE